MTSPRETVLCQYHYDPLDRLISHALQDTPERQRFYCNSRLTTEIQGTMRYSIVQQGDQLLAQQRSEGDVPDATLLATDQQRSVLQALKADYPRQSIAYSPYGHRPVESGLLSLLGFNGERPDPVTGCYLLGNGYRAFNPVLMRFNSPDSWSPFGKGGLNPYMYCLGDPINARDPLGHAPTASIMAFFKKSALTYANKALIKKTSAELSQAKHPTNFKKNELIKQQILEKKKTLISESSQLERAGKSTGDIEPFKLLSSSEQATEQYFTHQRNGIPFDDNGIPHPKAPITTLKDGREILRTDFFDDAIGFFSHQTQKSGPKQYIRTMQESAGKTIFRRAKYIRKHALRNYHPN